MDELEFRRRLLADPHDRDPEMLAAKQDSRINQKLASELEHLDALIDQTLRVNVPDELVDKILFKQTSTVCRENRKPTWHFAAAATFVLGILVGQANWENLTLSPPSENLAQIALKHYYNEADFTHTSNEDASLRQVNVKLSTLGAAFNHDLPGKVTYINYCGFDKQRAVHLVLKSNEGENFNVFIVPQTSSQMEMHSDGDMRALSLPSANNTSVIVVGGENSTLLPFAEQLNKYLNQEA